ncbi:MAG: fumarylacetoacetate hydrolase family protein [Chloroflexi bacterium]|nr:fumarylacetoacetate hydrolase family protein [Chloroflexota bacterium]
MLVNVKVQQAAQTLAQQYRSHQLYLLDDRLMPSDLEEAYLIQREFQTHISEEQGSIAGYKLAYTTAALQEANGVSEPCLGIMLEGNIHPSPSTLTADDFMQLGLECEVAVRLGSDLPASGAPYDRGKVSEAVESLTAAFEIIDFRRTPDQDPKVQFMTGVAANIFNAGVIMGDPVPSWRDLDLGAAYGSMTINGEVVGEGHGSDVMGHPLEPLAWLANKLAEQGFGLLAGMVIITGSIVSPKFVKPGDTASIMIEGLGGAELDVI